MRILRAKNRLDPFYDPSATGGCAHPPPSPPVARPALPRPGTWLPGPGGPCPSQVTVPAACASSPAQAIHTHACTHARRHARAHAHARARTHTHTHTYTRARAYRYRDLLINLRLVSPGNEKKDIILNKIQAYIYIAHKCAR